MTTFAVQFVFAALASLAQAPAPEAPRPLHVAGLPDDAPLAVTARRDGLVLRVRVVLQPEWHMYGRDTGGGQPVVITLGEGAFAAAGPLVVPMDAAGKVRGTAELELPLRRVGQGSALAATLRAIVCDPLQCLPPLTLDLSAPDEPQGPPQDRGPVRVLLVAVETGERADRIATFLRERGCAVEITTYAQATTEGCDRHEVVLCDSPVFGQHKTALKAARAFPRTAAPVVAVGFLGTELLEAHKVAMACGYI